MRKLTVPFTVLALVVALAVPIGLIASAQGSPSTLQETEEPIVTEDPGLVTLEPTLVTTEEPIATEEPGLEVTEDPAAPVGTQNLAYLRLAHFALDAPSVEVLIDGEPSDIQALNPGAITGWVETLAGEYQITLLPVDAGTGEAVLGPISYVLTPQTWTTIAVVGSVEADTVTAQVIREDFSLLDENMARVTVLHTLENGPAVDVVRADGSVLASAVAYAGSSTAVNSGSATFEVPAGTNDLQIVTADGTTVVDLTGTELQGGNFYFVVVTGTADAPRVQVESIPLLTLQEQTNAEFLPGATEEATEEPGLVTTEEPGLSVTEEPDLSITEEPDMGATEESTTG